MGARNRVWLWLLPPAAAAAMVGALVWLPAPDLPARQPVASSPAASVPAAAPSPKAAAQVTPTADPPPSSPAPSPAGLAPPASPAPSPAGVALPERFGAVRDVGGAGVQAPVAPGEPLERVLPPPPPPPPPPAVTAVPPPAAGKARAVLLFQPLVLSAGVIRAEGRTIRLAGITPLETGRVCARSGGAAAGWPCGMQARTALRQLVRGRAVACVLADPQATVVEAPCRVGAIDLAQWLVEQGWAEPAPGATADNALPRLAETARRLGRGMHSGG